MFKLITKTSDSLLSRYVRLQLSAGEFRTNFVMDRATRWATAVSAGSAALFVVGGVAQAAACNPQAKAAGSTISSFVTPITDFMMVLGGAGFVIMISLGAIMIMFGHTPDHASKGMKYVKNAFIGLALLLAAVLARTLVTTVVGGATTASGTAGNCQGIVGGT